MKHGEIVESVLVAETRLRQLLDSHGLAHVRVELAAIDCITFWHLFSCFIPKVDAYTPCMIRAFGLGSASAEPAPHHIRLVDPVTEDVAAQIRSGFALGLALRSHFGLTDCVPLQTRERCAKIDLAHLRICKTCRDYLNDLLIEATREGA